MVFPHRGAPPPHEQAQVLGDLRALLMRCREAELLLVNTWLRAELARLPSHQTLRLLRTPSAYDREFGPGRPADVPALAFPELAARIRRDLHELPLPELLVLQGWVRERLAQLGR